jgi:hypothetical protein
MAVVPELRNRSPDVAHGTGHHRSKLLPLDFQAGHGGSVPPTRSDAFIGPELFQPTGGTDLFLVELPRRQMSASPT